MILENIKHEISDFFDFLNKKSVVNTGIALIIALQVNNLFLDFIDDIVRPVASTVVSGNIDTHYIKFFGIKMKLGHLIVSIINFLITMIFLYYIYKVSKSTPGFFDNLYHGIRRGVKTIIPILPIDV